MTTEPSAIKAGDTVVLYGSRTRGWIATMSADQGAKTATEFGQFFHASIIGRRFGDRIRAQPPATGWVYALRPTPELWSKFLPHRTQVLYGTDIANIISGLGIGPGSVVVESGTGSGSLTYSLSRAVGPAGHVYTFEFHEIRATEARTSLGTLLGADCNVTVTHGDACAAGFCRPAGGPNLSGTVDAVFLDLPSPWLAVGHALDVLHPGGAFCAFSPCIEQVQRTCEELAAGNRFHSLRTIEVLERPYDAKKVPLPRLDSILFASDHAPPAKRQRGGTEDDADAEVEEPEHDAPATAAATPARPQQPEDAGNIYTCRPVADIRGHTGFLTFAIKSIFPPQPKEAPVVVAAAAAAAAALSTVAEVAIAATDEKQDK